MTRDDGAYRPEDFDFWSEAQLTDPFDMYRSFHERCPVAHSRQLGGFAFAAGYDAAKRVLNEFTVFSSRNGMVLPPRPERTYPSDLDPPEQQKFRRVINRNFTSQEVEKVRPMIEALVEKLIDGFIETGRADLADDLIRPALPPIVMPMIGVPVEDHDRIRDWIRPILRDRVSDPQGVVRAVQELTAYLEALVEGRRAEPPRDDALGSLLTLKDGAEPVTNNVIARVLIAILLGGLDTTTATALEALLYLSANPDEADRLRRGDVSWATAIEEFLRLFSPATAILRTVVDDVELGGQPLHAGEFVMALPGAANRDPTHFPEPDRCQLDREDNDHLSFGNGAHVCVGRFLARLEIEIFLKAVLTRLPDFRPADGFVPEYWTTSTRALKSLPVVFTPGAKSVQAAEVAAGA